MEGGGRRGESAWEEGVEHIRGARPVIIKRLNSVLWSGSSLQTFGLCKDAHDESGQSRADHFLSSLTVGC